MTTTYADAGVNLAAADEAVDRIADHLDRTAPAGADPFTGAFAAVHGINTAGMPDPVMVAATDGAGTKIELARQVGNLRSVGIDVVAMCANDIATTGAEPAIFLDYVATGSLDPSDVEDIVAGIADGCIEAGCTLAGGETAELPGIFANGSLDAAGFCVGIADRSSLLDPRMVSVGDELIGIASNGVHANGMTLLRQVFFADGGYTVSHQFDQLDTTIADELLKPTAIYVNAMRELRAAVPVHAAAHITGGGIPGNVPRMLPPGVTAAIDTETWLPPAIFDLVQQVGNVTDDEMWRVFNMGLGLIAAVPAGAAATAVDALDQAGISSRRIGRITEHHHGAQAAPTVSLSSGGAGRP